LQRQPGAAEPRDLLLPDVHLDGEEDGERPEGDAAEDAQDAVEEGQQDGEEGDERDEPRAPHQAEHVDAAVLLPGAGPPRRHVRLHGGEQRLQEHLEAAHQVEHDADVGEVHQPVGLVEARQDVPGRRVAERRVAQAAAHQVEGRRRHHPDDRRLPHRLVLGRRRSQRVLDLNQNYGVRVGERDVAQSLERHPYLLREAINVHSNLRAIQRRLPRGTCHSHWPLPARE